jgi:hypothetical protein
MDRTLVIKFDPRTVVILGAVLVMLAAWLPWSSLPSFLVGDLARQGFAAGGFLKFGLSVLALLGLLLPWRPLDRVSLLAAILAVVINVASLIAFVRVVQLSTSLELDLGAQLRSIGSGLYLTFAGAWLMLFGGLASADPLPGRSWLSYAAWGGMGGLLLAGCLCAWSIGLILRPVTLASPATPAATFGPAPTAYMATPLVDVQLEPLGSPGPRPPASPTPNRPGSPTIAPSGQNIPPSPTTRRSSPTATPTTLTPSNLTPSTLTPTFVPPAQATPTRSPTATAHTPTASPTPTPTSSPTSTPTTFTSPIDTPTATASPTPTPTETPET